jgi:hypothetical protein
MVARDGGSTALGAHEVQRTFSRFSANSTGLPGQKTHEAGRQYLGDFVEGIGVGFDFAQRGTHAGKLSRSLQKTSGSLAIAKPI